MADIGGVTQSFTLDAKGKAKNDKNTLKLSGKGTGIHIVKAAIKLLHGSFSGALADEGLVGDKTLTAQPVKVSISLLFEGQLYTSSKDQLYTVKLGSAGATKNKK